MLKYAITFLHHHSTQWNCSSVAVSKKWKLWSPKSVTMTLWCLQGQPELSLFFLILSFQLWPSRNTVLTRETHLCQLWNAPLSATKFIILFSVLVPVYMQLFSAALLLLIDLRLSHIMYWGGRRCWKTAAEALHQSFSQKKKEKCWHDESTWNRGRITHMHKHQPGKKNKTWWKCWCGWKWEEKRLTWHSYQTTGRRAKYRGGGIAVAVMMAFGNECDFLCGVNRFVGKVAVKQQLVLWENLPGTELSGNLVCVCSSVPVVCVPQLVEILRTAFL